MKIILSLKKLIKIGKPEVVNVKEKTNSDI